MTTSSDSSVTRCETCGHDHVCRHGYAANLGPDVWCCECDAGDDPFIALHPFAPAPAPSTDLASDETVTKYGVPVPASVMLWIETNVPFGDDRRYWACRMAAHLLEKSR